MWMNLRQCRPYHKYDGELRIPLSRQHEHLKFVHFSGFFGCKDQLELAIHILHSSVILEKMEITPRIEITQYNESGKPYCYESTHYINGRNIATKFVCKADQRKVVEVL
jgi:hypothetical protein